MEKPKTSFAGQMKLRGDAFDNYPADVIVKLTGQLVFTSPVVTEPKCRFRIVGQVIAPEGSEKALSAAIIKMVGQVVYYPQGTQPRIVLGTETFSQGFLEALTEREILVNLGQTCFSPDVQAQTFREKIHSIINLGRLKCDSSLLPVVQVLCRDNMGKIEAV